MKKLKLEEYYPVKHFSFLRFDLGIIKAHSLVKDFWADDFGNECNIGYVWKTANSFKL